MRILNIATFVAVQLVAAVALAQAPLDAELGGLTWGSDEATVLRFHQDAILANYRTQIAGIRDPLEIDRMRRQADERFATIRNSRVAFDGGRTGYEVSVVTDETQPGRGQSLIVARDEWSLRYFIFENDALIKLVVTYDQASMNFLGFEAFAERLEGVFGDPTSTDWSVDEIGVRHMARATWEDGTTRVRAEDKSQVFATYLVVYASVAADVPPLQQDRQPAVVARPGNSRDIGSIMRGIETPPDAGANGAIVDSLIGETTEVELQIRQEAVDQVAEPEEGSGDAAAPAASPTRTRTRPTTQPTEQRPAESEGVIY
ncbi:MAG: hypothetical protein H6699_08890 [Myxococcales bacterium]|nr:hypothetical protein [Myxococcales bacterium]